MSQPVTTKKTQMFLVVDDQELALYATINVLQTHYPQVEIIQAQTAQEALKFVANNSCFLDLVIVDLSMPEKVGAAAKTDAGIHLLKTLMQTYPSLNIVVQRGASHFLFSEQRLIH
jgi:DNA-binding NarL/FixJ family response regulator